jgi:hypothetical protein
VLDTGGTTTGELTPPIRGFFLIKFELQKCNYSATGNT